MTSPREVQGPQLPKALASWEKEGGAASTPKKDITTSWFVPPIVIPVLLGALVLARIAYLAYF
jgi:hypothetical protein